MRSYLILFLMMPFAAMASLVDAEQAYSEGKVQEALELYLTSAETQTSSGLQYNIANCYFRLGNTGKAILHYERAARLAPGDEDIQTNLSLARQQVVDRIAELPTLEIGNYWERFKAGSDVDQWARVSLFTCLFAFAAFAAALFMSGVWRKILIGLGGLLLVGTIVTAVLASSHKHDLLHGSQAIIIADRIEVMSAPDGGSKLFVLHEGTKVDRIREDGEWSEVKLSNGSVGWVLSERIELI